jgi:hypothetical protein
VSGTVKNIVKGPAREDGHRHMPWQELRERSGVAVPAIPRDRLVGFLRRLVAETDRPTPGVAVTVAEMAEPAESGKDRPPSERPPSGGRSEGAFVGGDRFARRQAA